MSAAQDLKALGGLSDYNPAYRHERTEVDLPKFLAGLPVAGLPADGVSTDVYDYIDESKIYPLVPRELRLSPLGSENGHSAPGDTNAVDLYMKHERM